MKRVSALLLALALTLPLSPALAAEASSSFSDVPADAWYAPYVEVCVDAGLMQGTGGGRFHPDGVVTIAEVDIVAARLETLAQTQWPQLEDWSYNRPFTPHAPTHEASRNYLAEVLRQASIPFLGVAINSSAPAGQEWPKDAQFLYLFGVLRGVNSAGTFDGERTLTRAELATTVARIVRSDLHITDAPPAHTADQLVSIYVGHRSFGYASPEYLIDLKNARFYAYNAPPSPMRMNGTPRPRIKATRPLRRWTAKGWRFYKRRAPLTLC